MRLTLLLCAAFALTTLTTVASAEPTFVAAHPGALKSGEGIASFTLSNPSGSAGVPLALTLGPVFDATTHAALPKAQVSLATSAGQDAIPKSLASGEKVALEAKVSATSGASAVDIAVFNQDALLGTLTLVSIDAPFNLSIDGSGSSDQPLSYQYDQPALLSLKNTDSEAYRLRWDLSIQGQSQNSGVLTVAANSSAHVPLKRVCYQPSIFTRIFARFSRRSIPDSVPCTVYSILDRIHPSNARGTLSLTMLPPGDPSGTSSVQSVSQPDSSISPPLPSRTLPVSLVMRRIGQHASDALSYLYAIVFLLAGGILSVLAGSVLPNAQKKVDLRVQLKALADRTTSVSTRIDSYLRVVLRLERKQIENEIRQISIWLPASSSPLLQIPPAIDTLAKRLSAAERLDELRRRHEQASATAPPSVTDDMDSNLQAAANQLHTLNLTDPDLACATALMNKVDSSLALLDNTDELAKQIAASLTALKTRFDRFPKFDFLPGIQSALSGVFVILDPARGYDNPANIVRQMLFAIDHGVAAIHLALDYAMVRASIPAPDSADCNDPGRQARDRLLARHCKLIDLLGTLSWRALREATLLVQQMREDIYEEDVFTEIESGRAEIFFDTQKPRPYLPVFFSIRFKDPRFDGSAALQCLVSQWSFPDGLCEYNCWKVCHYFSGNEREPAKPCAECAAPPTATQAVPSASPPAKTGTFPRKRPVPPSLETIVIHASVSGRRLPTDTGISESPLSSAIAMQRELPSERTRFLAELLRFAIAFGVALAGLLSGALTQFDKLDFLPATIAIVALGFGADSIKNLLTPAPAPPPKKN